MTGTPSSGSAAMNASTCQPSVVRCLQMSRRRPNGGLSSDRNTRTVSGSLTDSSWPQVPENTTSPMPAHAAPPMMSRA